MHQFAHSIPHRVSLRRDGVLLEQHVRDLNHELAMGVVDASPGEPRVQHGGVRRGAPPQQVSQQLAGSLVSGVVQRRQGVQGVEQLAAPLAPGLDTTWLRTAIVRKDGRERT